MIEARSHQRAAPCAGSQRDDGTRGHAEAVRRDQAAEHAPALQRRAYRRDARRPPRRRTAASWR